MSHAESLASEYVDAALLSALPDLEIQARYLVSGFLSGLHRSPMKGGSSEFKEFRSYQPGDELKMIDWKIYARTDKLHVRLREEDTDMRCYIALDSSASMAYKSPKATMSKWNFARAIAAALVFYLHRQRDAVSLSFIGADLEDYVKAASRASHIHTIMANLHREAAVFPTDIPRSLETLIGLVKRRSIAVVISDFYSEIPPLASALAKLRHLNCEVLLLHVLDPRELRFDFDEPVQLQELEGHTTIPVSPDLIREDYKRKIEAHIAAVSSAASSVGGEHVLLPTDEVPLKALGSYLHRREMLL